MRRLLKITLLLFTLIIAVCLVLNFWISTSTRSHIYYDLNLLPKNQIGVVLGTSKYLKKGGINSFYQNRINGAIYLYLSNKVDYLLVSGDNQFMNYNEPITMQKDLIKSGIPSSVVVLDYAGFRTLDSIIRANKIFNANGFTIITQEFHCERALFIAEHEKIDAQCFAVETPDNSFMVRAREVLARISMLIDLYITHKTPKFLGKIHPIIIEEQREIT